MKSHFLLFKISLSLSLIKRVAACADCLGLFRGAVNKKFCLFEKKKTAKVSKPDLPHDNFCASRTSGKAASDFHDAMFAAFPFMLKRRLKLPP